MLTDYNIFFQLESIIKLLWELLVVRIANLLKQRAYHG